MRREASRFCQTKKTNHLFEMRREASRLYPKQNINPITNIYENINQILLYAFLHIPPVHRMQNKTRCF